VNIARYTTLALLGLTLFATPARADAPPSPGPAPAAPPTAAPTAAPSASPTATPTSEAPPVDGSQALFRLLTGNTRFTQGRTIHANQGAATRAAKAKRSRPWCVVVTCSDSRVPPEIVFDQGLGDMFVVRTWGTHLGETAIGSLEHAIADHSMNLIVVLGHSQCLAVKACIDGKQEPGAAARIVASKAAAVAISRRYKGDLLTAACKEDARLISQRISSYPFVSQRLKSGKFRVVPAFYDLETGNVKVLNPQKQP